MRRLLAPVAALAVVLLAPSASLATANPVLNGPVTPVNAGAPNVNLTWNDVRPLPILLSATYQVSRAPMTCATALPGDFQAVGPLQTDQFGYPDPRPADGAYCYVVRADDGSGPADSNLVDVAVDAAAPVITATAVGGTGCSLFTVSANATDSSPFTMTVNGVPYTPGSTFTPGGAEFASVDTTFVATDAFNNPSPIVVSGRIWDQSRPPSPALEVDTEPAAHKATLTWESAPEDGAPILNYRVRRNGPDGLKTTIPASPPLAFNGLLPDATYQFTLDASDVCGFGTPSVRLLRLNDTTPPSAPLVAQPAFDSTRHTITLSWVASADNIQIDHYVILLNGIPLAATDATVFTDTAPAQHAFLTYVVRAVDTNGNETDSAPATITTPDWTPPTAPILTVDPPQGTTVTLHWPAARDNVGVVRYTVLRDDKLKATMTASVRTYKDINVPPGVHTWRVIAFDNAGLSAGSAPQTKKIVKPLASAHVVSLRMVGGRRGGAASYSLKGSARLLLDLRVVGTLPKALLRIYVQNGKGRITVWRGTPAASAPKERLSSSLVRHGYVAIHLGRTLHAGRIRLVLITSGPMVIVGRGKHKPSMTSG